MTFFSDAIDRVQKDADVGDVHVDTGMGNGKPKRKKPLTFGAALTKLADRQLEPIDDLTSHPPFEYDPTALHKLRPDQIPRFYGALTDKRNLEWRELPLDSLVASQNRVETAKVHGKLDSGTRGEPLVTRFAGKNYIADGHHDLAADYLAGNTTAKVRYYDLEPFSNLLKSRDSVFKRALAKAVQHWPKGTPGGLGGKFEPKDGGAGLFERFLPKKEPKAFHPHVDDHGQKVGIFEPSTASHPDTWSNAASVATFTPGGPAPAHLGGVELKQWTPPTTAQGWQNVAGQAELHEPPLPDIGEKRLGAGVVIQEPDGRVWLTAPTNGFGGYKATFPKGGAEAAIPSLQANAIKEAYEETGLKVRLTGYLGDHEGDTSFSRYYLAEREGGTPADMGWETQAVHLAPGDKLDGLLNRKRDRDIAAQARITKVLRFHQALAKGFETEARWPKGSPLGGQWMGTGADGLALVPKIGSAANPQFMKKGHALLTAAQDGDEKMIETFLANGVVKGHHEPIAAGANSQSKWNKQLHQYAAKLKQQLDEKANAKAAPAPGGPLKITDMKLVGAKPGGSASGGIYQDATGQKWLVKGYGSTDQAKSEVLASKLYAAAGANVPHMELIDLAGTHKGGLGVASKMLDEKFHGVNPANLAEKHLAQEDFAADAWLANWDTVGLSHDNLVITESGKAVRIDPGGSLDFKAMGGKKGALFGNSVTELHTLRNQAINPQAHSVFGSMTNSQIIASAKKVEGVSHQQLADLVAKYGPGTAVDKLALAKKLASRQADLEKQAKALADLESLKDFKIAEPPAKAVEQAAAVVVKPGAPDFEAHKLPLTNTNAASHNKKVEQIQAMHKAGDAAGLQGMKFGQNTYNKKAQKLAQDALASLGHDQPKVPAGATLVVPKPAVAAKPAIDFATQPKPHDFANWSGPGAGLSSAAWKNQANQDAESTIHALGAKGDLPGLQAAKFNELNPKTGVPTGAIKPMAEHPSKYVQNFHSETVDWLDDQLHPPEPLTHIPTSEATTIGVVDKQFPAKAFAAASDKVKANHKLGFWYALGSVSHPERLAPAKSMNVSAEAISAAHAAFPSLSPKTKAFINAMQGSGAFAGAYRIGAKTYGGHDLAALSKAAHAEAVALPAGTTVYRYQNMPEGMLHKLQQADPGTVIQATGPMPTSYDPSATSGFGQHRVEIQFAPGAKAVMSFGSGKFAGEKEITTLPNARFVLMSKGMEADPKGGQRMHVKLLMLPPDGTSD